MTDDLFDAPDRQLALARCTRCGRFAGEYWRDRGWDTTASTCTCYPAPVLPVGAALGRALGRGRGDGTTTIRVC